jgi:phosphoglycolate phosphatase-like HAD superfamily hydrolase
MSSPIPVGLRVLMLDADGSLFPSEAPAFVASADVTNRFLASLGVPETYSPERLLATTTGKNFRATAVDLATAHGLTVEPGVLDDWVAEEKSVVSEHLGRVLRPDPGVLEPLDRLAARYRLAAVSSSALSRLVECFRATGLDALIPARLRYSAEDSLPVPTSKPDPRSTGSPPRASPYRSGSASRWRTRCRECGPRSGRASPRSAT